MWRPWSRAFEALGRIRFLLTQAGKLKVGDPTASDARGGWGWKAYAESETLYDVWGPVPESPWLPFHCVPLFAALDRIPRDRVGPPPPRDVPEAWAGSVHARPALPGYVRPHGRTPAWSTGETWIMLDLSGPASVEAAAWLVTADERQPVCTFDNWPHAKGLIRAEDVLAELLRWASAIADTRPRLRADSPPLWVCDSQRLGTRAGSPGEFDNRYYLDDSVLPAASFLGSAGIGRVVYATMGGEEIPVLDLESYFAELLSAGLDVLHAQLMYPDGRLEVFAAPRKPGRRRRARRGGGG
jgi:hypothetical protein